MAIIISDTPEQLGAAAAKQAAEVIRGAIAAKGKARIVLSTGASQFQFIQAFVKESLDWSKVEMFHLDEYVGLPETHIASFRKYLKERFADIVPVGRVFYVNGEGDVAANIKALTEELRKEPIDLSLIGIGENSHIAFNDPPADFDTREAYIVVDLDDDCKNQQVGEGWFATIDDVPKQAISMTVHQIMQANTIISCVPHKVKANAIKLTMENELTNLVPSTMLKTHADWTLYVDRESASLLDSAAVQNA
ncbi:glucosamine-6-phosphate deaminase [Paenibacillus hemerocallicola]|jgi:glucosamine-6-phosphate deaminase|uniref:Glucosamine-6-phosphate deaminase n=1 Tax=Paenibacillus hemerocallicola TaxID=1172614 RepID=A0A5C4TG82_9BACL|nr:glucosamine-6-phosphate deaminase [Paenibacillus hemerocallicola]TNJ68051.1 glucosamine-6-phosphate deaminase [Paenibacillus hemerocallicola]